MSSSISRPPERISQGTLPTTVRLGENGSFSLNDNTYCVAEVPSASAIVDDVDSTFNFAGFERARTPFVIGDGDLSAVAEGTIINSLPVKFPGTEYRVPNELRSIRDLLEKCVAYEGKLNPFEGNYYAYVSLQRSTVQLGEQQRSAIIHSDGIQGRRITPKVPIEHGYTVVDKFPTYFFPQSFDMTGIDVNRHLMDSVFEQQVDRRKAISFPVGSIVVFDAYCIHQPAPAIEATSRAFFRLTYSTREYDRIGNSVNALFNEEYNARNWEFQPRPLPTDLEEPPTKGLQN